MHYQHNAVHKPGSSYLQNPNRRFHVKVARTLEEACKLLEVGFEYVCDMDNAQDFQKA